MRLTTVGSAVEDVFGVLAESLHDRLVCGDDVGLLDHPQRQLCRLMQFQLLCQNKKQLGFDTWCPSFLPFSLRDATLPPWPCTASHRANVVKFPRCEGGFALLKLQLGDVPGSLFCCFGSLLCCFGCLALLQLQQPQLSHQILIGRACTCQNACCLTLVHGAHVSAQQLAQESSRHVSALM